MVATYYKGHTLRLATGTKVHHEGKLSGEKNTPGYIVLDVVGPYGDGVAASMTVDEALKLATTLLRDVSMLRFGSG